MKITLLFLVFSFCFITNAQTNKIVFEYDTAGNQTKRYLCINCSSTTGKNVVNEIEALKEDDLLKFSAEDIISYYPNPVKEELYLKWDLKNDNYVTLIQVFSITSQLLQTYNVKADINTQNIPFQNYSTGVYLVIVYYKNGDQKSIKILKQ